MPTVVIHREDGQTIEISELTFEQVKELAGVDGHGAVAPRRTKKRVTPIGTIIETSGPDIHGFISELTERGRLFIKALRDNPSGVEANDLAAFLKLNDPRQIGGFTGGGLAKMAKKFGIKMRDIYSTQVTFPDGKRRRMFYPGKLIKSGAI